MFIEVTKVGSLTGRLKKEIINLDYVVRVYPRDEDVTGCYIVTDRGGTEVEESYEMIKSLIPHATTI